MVKSSSLPVSDLFSIQTVWMRMAGREPALWDRRSRTSLSLPASITPARANETSSCDHRRNAGRSDAPCLAPEAPPTSARPQCIPLQRRAPQVGRGGAGGADWPELSGLGFPAPPRRPITGRLGFAALPSASEAARWRVPRCPAGGAEPMFLLPTGPILKARVPTPRLLGAGAGIGTASRRGRPGPTEEGPRPRSRRGWHASVSVCGSCEGRGPGRHCWSSESRLDLVCPQRRFSGREEA